MARGQPDYGMYAPTEQYATISDLAKAIAWVIDYLSADGRGTVVYRDDFEGTLFKWGKVTSNGGTSLFNSTHARSGSQSVELDTAKVLTASAGIWREFGVQSSQRLGSEINFCKPNAHTSFVILLSHHEGTLAYQAEAKIDFSNNELSIRTGASTWVVIATLDAFSGSEQSFHPFKLVADFDAKIYKRVMVDSTWYDLEAYSLYSFTTALTPRIYWELRLDGLDATGGQLYLDDAIFTQEEP